MACVANGERDPSVSNKDSIAPQLLRWSDGSFAAAKIRPLHPVIRKATERICPGIYGYALARGHHMDEIVRQELAAGIDALVILGAGYDTRAYRMSELADVRVLEVDRPATSREKRSRLARALGSMPANVAFVEVDFTHHDLLERLADHGQEGSAGTLFLLSGVSMYLTGDAMASLFEQVAAHTSERTSLLFDYVDVDVLTAPDRYYGKEWVAYATKVGEEPQWGIPAGEAEAVLGAHGLKLASHLCAEELMSRYLRRADGSTVARPFEFGAVAHAFVAR